MIYCPHIQTKEVTIDAKTVAASLIHTTENGSKRFYPWFVEFEILSGSAILAVATLSIGTNSATYNNVLAAMALTGLTANNALLRSPLIFTAAGSSIAANTGIYVNITTGFTATTASLLVMLHGVYR